MTKRRDSRINAKPRPRISPPNIASAEISMAISAPVRRKGNVIYEKISRSQPICSSATLAPEARVLNAAPGAPAPPLELSHATSNTADSTDTSDAALSQP